MRCEEYRGGGKRIRQMKGRDEKWSNVVRSNRDSAHHTKPLHYSAVTYFVSLLSSLFLASRILIRFFLCLLLSASRPSRYAYTNMHVFNGH